MHADSILVLAETREGVAAPLTLELLGLAQTVARDFAATVEVVVQAGSESIGEQLIAHGADRVHVFDKAAEDRYENDAWVDIVEAIAWKARPIAIFAGHTPVGADVAPRLAFRLETGVATACVGVSVESGKLLFTRPCYGGNVRETISFASRPAIATIKAGVGTRVFDPSRTGEVSRVRGEQERARSRVIARKRDDALANRLEDAKIVVAGGRGLEGPEGFRVLEGLADVLGAAVGSSRVPCDLGWCPHSWQIGLTGKTVTPDLYLAIGISGAGHHMAGCGNSKTIVAINSDPEAAIFREARFGIVGDYRKIVPALTDAVLQIKQS
jgi:electron transfer flavoprotein alpha subunit